MSLLGRVVEHLRERRTAFTLIGAAALAVHGVSRSTRDIDLLVVDAATMDPSYWEPMRREGVDVTIRRGDADDPLTGVARLRAPDGAAVDLIVGKLAWQREILEITTEAEVDGVRVPVARKADLILLKLYAGGPQDAWDVEQLLDSADRPGLATEIDARAGLLPPDSQRLWQRIRSAGAC